MPKNDLERIVSLVVAARRNREEFISLTAVDRNPQVAEMRHRAEGASSAYLAVIDALRGDEMLLRVAVSGRIDARATV